MKSRGNALIVFIVLIALIAGGVLYFRSQSRPPADDNSVLPSPLAAPTPATPETGEVAVTTAPAGPFSPHGTILAGTSPAGGGAGAPLIDFNQADYEAAKQADKVIVLYFYANWCPICRAEFPMAEAAFNQLTTDNVVGFRVNYNDNQTDADEKALARQFGVPYQHTKVIIKNGALILKAPEGWDTATYVSKITAAATN